MKRIAKILQKASENVEENQQEVCIYPKCNLKSIEGYNFCYQHVYADKLTKKTRKCSFKTNEETCNELITTLPNEDNNYCTFHSTLEKNREKRNIRKGSSSTAASITIDESKYKLIDDLNVDSKNVLNEQAIRKQTEKHLGENQEQQQQQQQDEDLIDFDLFDSEDSNLDDDDLDYEDALEHASVYTQEEVLKIFQVKLNKLQRLYKKQMNLLNERMKYDRKVFLLLHENEKLRYGQDHELEIKNQAEKELLKAAKIYKKYSGLKVYLKENFVQNNEATASATSAFSTKSKPECVFIENNKKCESKTVPLSKYCLNHILNDPNQILFCACDESTGCKVPVVASVTPNCPLHLAASVLEKLKTNEEAKAIAATSQQTPSTSSQEIKTTTINTKQDSEEKKTATTDAEDADDDDSNTSTSSNNTSSSSSSSTSSSTSATSSTSNTSSSDSSDSSSNSSDETTNSSSSSTSSPEKQNTEATETTTTTSNQMEAE